MLSYVMMFILYLDVVMMAVCTTLKDYFLGLKEKIFEVIENLQFQIIGKF